MKPTFFSLLLAIFLGVLVYTCEKANETESLVEVNEKLHLQVDPFIGTGFHGHTFPGATTPFGMVQLSPDTRWEGWDACSGYHYDDDSLYGFAHTHLSGTGATDLSDVLFVPTVEAERFRAEIRAKHLPKQGFSHDDEYAHAGYYRVKLESGIEVELTTSEHVGGHRYTFPEESTPALVIDLVQVKEQPMREASLTFVSDTEISGHQVTDGWVDHQHVYFYAVLSQPVVKHELFLDGTLSDGATIHGDSVRGIFYFSPEMRTLEVMVGLSFVSEAEAKANLEAQLMSFEEMKSANEAAWDEVLSVVEIPRGREEDLTNFYTALYHSFIAPNRTSDVSGTYRGNDDQVRQLGDGEVHYSTFSLWDTYRTLHPFFTLVDHEVVGDFVASMLRMYDEQGELPIWPLASGETRTMIGYHAASVIADAYLRGVPGIDAERALAAMVHSSNINRKGSEEYVAHGYIPCNTKNESVSCTLEYSYDDWAIAMMAKAMGEEEIYNEYMERAKNYVRVFDGSSRFFRGKDSEGAWRAPFDPYEVSRDYTEASAWQYRYAAVQDVYGMAQLHGGEAEFAAALDELFWNEGEQKGHLQDITGLIGQYAHGNEPSHHIAFLYNYVGQPWKTQELTRRILDEMYSATPEGIIGNEDCGQMSAWLIMSALGFYPVTPGSGEYLVTAPLFPEAKLHTALGKELVIRANNPESNKYIERITLNGKEINRLFLTYDELVNGGELVFHLTDEPVKDFKVSEQPYSMTAQPTVSPVYAEEEVTLFESSTTVTLASATQGATIFYTLDGSEPTDTSERYTEPIRLTDGVTIKAIGYHADMQPSVVTTLYATKAEYLPPVEREVQEGVKYSLYHGAFDSVQEITGGAKVKSGVTDEISIDVRDRDEFYGIIFEGFLEIPETGVYEFQVTSDDGSVLQLGSAPVVLNDGSHSFISATGKIALSSGLHPFNLSYWQGDQGQGVRLRYRLRGMEEYQEPILRH